MALYCWPSVVDLADDKRPTPQIIIQYIGDIDRYNIKKNWYLITYNVYYIYIDELLQYIMYMMIYDVAM